jgi:hypothetical protein
MANETWFIVEGISRPIKADELKSYYPIRKIVHGSYEKAVIVWQLIFYGQIF